MSKKQKNKVMTSANVVTIVRICLVPVFVAALLSPWTHLFENAEFLDQIKPWIALIIFVILALTDSLDGYLARSRGEVTDFGKFLDPLADKILVAAALIALVELGDLPTWVVLVILMREFIVSGVRMLAASEGLVVAASWYGKIKTVLQIIAIILFILKDALADYGCQQPGNPLYITAWIVMILALIMTIVSMIDYCYKCRSVLGFRGDDESIETKLVKLTSENGITFGCAESLTCGLIASRVGGVSGASKSFAGGLTTYTYKAKNSVLGIDIEYLEKNGAVSSFVAENMADSSSKILKCNYTVSTTGVAGPERDEANNEVGLVYIGIHTPNKTYSKKFNFSGDRKSIRKQSAQKALDLLFVAITCDK